MRPVCEPIWTALIAMSSSCCCSSGECSCTLASAVGLVSALMPRMLQQWCWRSPANKLCMVSITVNQVGSQYDKHRSSDQRTPNFWYICAQIVSVCASLHDFAIARCSCHVHCLQDEGSVLENPAAVWRQNEQNFPSTWPSPAKPADFWAARRLHMRGIRAQRTRQPNGWNAEWVNWNPGDQAWRRSSTRGHNTWLRW